MKKDVNEGIKTVTAMPEQKTETTPAQKNSASDKPFMNFTPYGILRPQRNPGR